MKSLIKAVVRLNFLWIACMLRNMTTKDSSVWFVNGNGKKLRMMLDTGASTNGISCKTLRKLRNSPALRSSNVRLKAYGP